LKVISFAVVVLKVCEQYSCIAIDIPFIRPLLPNHGFTHNAFNPLQPELAQEN